MHSSRLKVKFDPIGQGHPFINVRSPVLELIRDLNMINTEFKLEGNIQKGSSFKCFGKVMSNLTLKVISL